VRPQTNDPCLRGPLQQCVADRAAQQVHQNQIVGEECEAFEIYSAESRLAGPPLPPTRCRFVADERLCGTHAWRPNPLGAFPEPFTEGVRKGSGFGITQLIGDLTYGKVAMSKHGGRQLETNFVTNKAEAGL
jgi:hypothetical protein